MDFALHRKSFLTCFKDCPGRWQTWDHLAFVYFQHLRPLGNRISHRFRPSTLSKSHSNALPLLLKVKQTSLHWCRSLSLNQVLPSVWGTSRWLREKITAFPSIQSRTKLGRSSVALGFWVCAKLKLLKSSQYKLKPPKKPWAIMPSLFYLLHFSKVFGLSLSLQALAIMRDLPKMSRLLWLVKGNTSMNWLFCLQTIKKPIWLILPLP